MFYVVVWAGLLLLTGAVASAEVGELFSVELPVASREDSHRAEAFRRGIEMVMGRIVRTEDLNSATVRAIQAHPQDYVLQYQYLGGTNEESLRVKVDFDETRIKDGLQRKGIRTFGPERPETLVWLALEDGTNQRMLDAETMPDFESQVRAAASERGLPIQIPLDDLEDRQRLAPNDLISGNAIRIRQAAARYETPVILAGVLRRKPPEHFEADWKVYLPDREERWKAPAAGFADAVRSGLAGVYSRLASQLIPSSLQAADLQMRVSGITSLDDVNRVTAALRKLPPVSKVEWLTVGTGDAVFKLRVTGGKALFERYLSFDRHLRRETAADSESAASSWRLQK